jgi:tetratricopeptide (TPR) repeat protein
MSNAAKHRKKAAEFEQLKQIDRAIAAYAKAIEESEAAGGEVDVALYNKVGDLALRQGRVPDALTYYERAVEHYATSGLFNNAIALCNKILRNAPGRANVYFTLGRISARKGLRGDATRNFLEYATRMQQDGRIEEGIRALAEVLDLMPELNDVRTMVEELASRSGIALPRRKTPLRNERVATPVASPSVREQKSQDLVFLDVEYSGPKHTPPRGARVPTPALINVVPPPAPTDSVPAEPLGTRSLLPAPGLPLLDTSERVPVPPVVDEPIETLEGLAPTAESELEFTPRGTVEPPVPDGLEANGDFAQGAATSLLDGFTLDDALAPSGFDAAPVIETEPTIDITWIVPPEPESEVAQLAGVVSDDVVDAANDPGVVQTISTEFPPYVEMVVPAADPTPPPLVAIELEFIPEQLPPDRPPYRLDPHDFILPGELPPLRLDDTVVEAGLQQAVSASLAAAADAPVVPSPASESAVVSLDVLPPAVELTSQAEMASTADIERGPASEPAVEIDAEAEGERPGTSRGVGVTPSLPIAAVAEAAQTVASSRRDSLRVAVGRMPKNWLLRRRLAEALFESGERDAALHELETAQQGLFNDGEFVAASDIAEELVQVSPDRVGYHQKRVELAVRSHDQQWLRIAYLDLADALVRLGEEGRARAVYARVLEIDPYDDRARAALGAAAPPPPAPVSRPEARFVDLADWLSDDDAPADTRMRMREPAISGDEQADFDALLRHFKEGVSRSLGEDDFESHYDLGVAYKEMGLLDDAIAEFQKALRSRAHRLPAYEALGQCFVEQGRFQVAATVLSRALYEPGLTDDQRVGVLYLLAYSCEALQRKDEARSYFQRVYATDINFRDVAARLAALEQAPR